MKTYLVDPMPLTGLAWVACFPWGTAVLCCRTSCLVWSSALWDPTSQLETHIITIPWRKAWT